MFYVRTRYIGTYYKHRVERERGGRKLGLRRFARAAFFTRYTRAHSNNARGPGRRIIIATECLQKGFGRGNSALRGFSRPGRRRHPLCKLIHCRAGSGLGISDCGRQWRVYEEPAVVVEEDFFPSSS